MELTSETPLAEVEVKAAGLWVPCQEDIHSVVGFDGESRGKDCSVCHGSGRIYPLQVPCPCRKFNTVADREGAHRRWLHELNLPDCQGRGWVFNREPDAIPDAVKAKGWPWETSRHTLEGIAVDIYDGFNTLGEVTADEGITSRYHAEVLAVARAVEAQNGTA